MARRRRKSLERDSQLLAEAVPIMKAALDSLVDYEQRFQRQVDAISQLQLELRVCAGENAKLQAAYIRQGYQVIELIERNDQLLLDQTAYVEDEFDQSGEVFEIKKYDPTEEPFA